MFAQCGRAGARDAQIKSTCLHGVGAQARATHKLKAHVCTVWERRRARRTDEKHMFAQCGSAGARDAQIKSTCLHSVGAQARATHRLKAHVCTVWERRRARRTD